jgi:SAM-dependent methyltransferase
MVGNVMEICSEIKECIACGSNHLMSLLGLGTQPLANSFLKNEDELEVEFPLATNYCKNCYHVQLTHKVNPDLLFKNYLYVSGTAKTQIEYFDWFANFVMENRDRKDMFVSVLDIGCNDGSQLDAFTRYSDNNETKVITRGVDPAENLYEISSRNHHVHCGYFDDDYVKKHQESTDIVICQNAFAHNYDQLNFLKNMARVVSNHGHIYITISQANMIINGEFDTIYHEHLSFYNIRSMNELCKRAGVNLIDVVAHPIHGTSYIFVISKTKARPAYIDLLLKQEESMNIYDDETYEAYKLDCEEIIKAFAETVKVLRETKKVIGYGAPAKGNTLLNAAGVDLDYIVDDNPLKQGLYTPGRNIRVLASETIKHEDGDVVFVPLAWNFFDEIKSKIKAMRPDREDMFLKYFPFVYMG